MRRHASESKSLSFTSSKQSFIKNSKIESKKDVIIIGSSMLNGINEEGLSNDRCKIKVKNHSGGRKTFVALSDLMCAKNQI